MEPGEESAVWIAESMSTVGRTPVDMRRWGAGRVMGWVKVTAMVAVGLEGRGTVLVEGGEEGMGTEGDDDDADWGEE